MNYPHLCLECEAADMAQDTRDVVVSKGEFSETAPAVRGWFCPHCGNVEFLGEGDGRRVSEALARVSARHKASQAAFIRATRKQLRLSQLEAARLFGGGSSSFSEYENGKTQPPKSMLALLRLLSKHPELLPELLDQAV